jgi:hypothetical protein
VGNGGRIFGSKILIFDTRKGASGHLHAQVALFLRKDSQAPVGEEIGWDIEPLWTRRRKENSSLRIEHRSPSSRAYPVILLTGIPALFGLKVARITRRNGLRAVSKNKHSTTIKHSTGHVASVDS